MHYFGDFALYMPWLILARRATSRTASRSSRERRYCSDLTRRCWCCTSRPCATNCCSASFPGRTTTTFEDTRPMFSACRRRAPKDPGIVLADNNAGHYIRYYTDCPVIGEQLPADAAALRGRWTRAERLFASSSARDLARAAPPSQVRAGSPARHQARARRYRARLQVLASSLPAGLRCSQELLLRPAVATGAAASIELLDEIKLPGPERLLYARTRSGVYDDACGLAAVVE